MENLKQKIFEKMTIVIKEDVRNQQPRKKENEMINHHRYHHHCVLEPQNLLQKVWMMRMNALEIACTSLIGAAAIWQASWFSSFLYFMFGMLFIASKRFVPERMKKRQQIAKIIFFVLVADITFKIIIFINGVGQTKESSAEKIEQIMRWSGSFGIFNSLDKKPKTLEKFPLGKVELKFFESFLFEIILFIVLGVFYYFTRKTQRNITYLDINALQVLQMKQKEADEKLRQKQEAEDKKKNTQKEEEEDYPDSQRGSEVRQKEMHKSKSTVRDKELQQQRLQELQKLEKDYSKYRNYIECETFKKSHDIYFKVIMVSNILQAIIFNSVVDISVLFLFLLIQSTYAYKSYLKEAHLKLMFFTVYWCQLVTQLKIQFVIQMYIPEICYRIKNNQTNIYVKIIQAYFGLDFIAVEDGNKSTKDHLFRVAYYVSLFISLYSTQLWKQAKWGAIRDMWINEHNKQKEMRLKQKETLKKEGLTSLDDHDCEDEDEPDQWGSNYTMFSYYVKMHNFLLDKKHLEQSNNDIKETWNKVNIEVNDLKGEKKEEFDRLDTNQQVLQTEELRTKFILNQTQSKWQTYGPTLVLWTTRIMIAFQSYMYTQQVSLIQLAYVCFTFVFSNQYSLFVGIMFMIPYYSALFLIIYLKRIQHLKEYTDYFCYKYDMFEFDFKMPVLETALFYAILTNLFLMITCLKSSISSSKDVDPANTYFINQYKKKLINKNASIFWILSFNLVKHLHQIFFLLFFARAMIWINQINSLFSLSFVLLFAMYITWGEFYRRTSYVPLIIISQFILTRYYYDMNYHVFQTNKYVNDWANWLGMWSKDYTTEVIDWKIGSSVYFRVYPMFMLWVILVVFKELRVINQMCLDKAQMSYIETKIYETMRQRYSNGTQQWNNIKYLIGNQLIYFYIVIMIFLCNQAQGNMITFIMWVQNVILIGTVCAQDKSLKNLNRQMKITNRMKIFAACAIISDTVFMSLIGVHPIGKDSNFEKQMPWLYKHLALLGLKIPDHVDGKTLTQPERSQMIRAKLVSQAIYLIMSILMYNYFLATKNAIKCEQNWNNDDFQKLYLYTSTIKNSKHKKQKNDDDDNNSDEEIQKLMQENKTISIETFKKKKTYTKYDIEDRYNFRRWQTSFIVYQLINWWPIMDAIATMSPLLSGGIIMYVALYQNVSLLMFLFVASQGHFFYVVIKKIQKYANDISITVTILSQIDIEFGNNLSKIYNESCLRKFYETRSSLWKFQLKLVQLMAIMGSLAGIVTIVRDKIERDELTFSEFPDVKKLPKSFDANPLDFYEPIIKFCDKIEYWFYFLGVFQGNDVKENANYFTQIGILFLALFIDKSSINWLKNRWGCTYFNFQKFVELETRRKAIKEKWLKLPIPYKPEHYRYHNFYKPVNFEIVYQKLFEHDGFKQRDENEKEQMQTAQIKETMLDQLGKEQAANKSSEFIPHKVAQRLQAIIRFTLRVDGRDHSLDGGFENDTDVKLDDLFEHIDTEKEFKELQNKLSENRKELKQLKTLYEDQMIDTNLQEQVQELEEKIESRQASYELLQKKTQGRKYEEFDIEEKYEEIEILKKFKIKSLEKILKKAITTKYKISYYKGMIFLCEALIMMTLMISIALKSNIFSLVYLIFVIKYPFCEIKHYLFARLCLYLSISLSIQYALYWLNLTKYTEIENYKFPKGFQGYPFEQMKHNPNYMKDNGFPFPIMFSIESFIGKKNFLQQAYFLGIGINSVQLENLMLDFLNLFMVTMYVLFFRNPIFEKDMKKVFWKYPNSYDEPEKWNRLDDKVQHQQEWRQDPLPITDKKYKTIRDERHFSESEMQGFNMVYQTTQFRNAHYFDYDKVLYNYVDLKYQEIWSNKFVKKIKNQLKDQISYFRVVKQGSQIIYLGFHIITIFVVILLSIMRQSLISLVYLIVILIKIMYSVEDALKERSQNLVQEIEDLEIEIKKNVKDLKQLEEMNEMEPTLDKDEQIQILKQEIESQNISLRQDRFNHLQAKSEKKQSMKNKQDSEIKKKKPSSLSYNFRYTLQILVIIDFCSQIICQMPFIQLGPEFEKFGFRKIWSTGIPGADQKEAFNYDNFMEGTTKYTGLQIKDLPFSLQILNCFMIVFVFTQVSIFNSPGYLKYVTQKDGSLNLLLQLSILKGKSVAYRFNNSKILNIIKIQKNKELVVNNFEELKQRMKNWRIMKKQTLDIGINGIINQKQELDEDKKQQSQEKKKEHHFKKCKTVNFEVNNEEASQQFSSCDEDEENDHMSQQADEEQTVDEIPSIEEKQKFLRRMGSKLVEIKIKRINFLVDIYQFVQKHWIEQIFFKNQKVEVEQLLVEHSQGSVNIPTELERIMEDEAYDYITSHFQNSSNTSDNELNKLCTKFKNLEQQSHENIDFKIIDILQAKISEDSKLVLSDMSRTWEFTRPGTMCMRLLETFFYLFLSQIQYVIYIMMIYSTYQNAGLITIIYPFMIFGWALLEETRPTKRFWQILKVWTSIVLFLKFFANIKWTPAQVAQSVTHKVGLDKASAIFHEVHQKQAKFMSGELFSYVKLGLFSYDNITDITIYILPEIIILCLLMVNSIYLRMLGFRNQSEDDIEDVIDGIHRTIERGDIEKVKQHQKLNCYMNLSQQFPSVKAQKKQKKKDEEAMKYLDKQKLQMNPNHQVQIVQTISPEDRLLSQESELKKISKSIKNSTQNFKLETNEQENEQYQEYVNLKLFQKVLDDDSFCYIEGYKPQNHDDFISKQECEQNYLDLIADEVMSGGDNEVEINQKSDRIKLRNKPETGIFGKVRYFNRLFPDLKIQKPGYDLYGSTNIFLTIVVLFVFTFYGEFNVSEGKVIPGKQAGNTFSNGLIYLVLFVILCMLLERFANRTATKAPSVNQGLDVEEGALEGNKSYWNQASLVVSPGNTQGKKENYTRWNRGLHNQEDPRKKIKLSDKSSLDYLEDLQEENKTNKTKISVQQKVKYVMHMMLLIIVHLYVFWFVPITGNIQLYGSPVCDKEKEKYYGCKDFHHNPLLKIFYLVLCMYLFLSAMQIKYGLPIRKMPSSVLQYNDNLVAYGASNVFMALPFILEIRTLIDFSFAQTSLDIFQFWELYQANFDMYNGKNGNIYYFQKVIGEPMPFLDRCLMGFTFSGIVLAILVGPLILFSPLAGFIAPNPVLNAEMNVNFLITRQLSDIEMKKFVTGNMDAALQEYDSLNVTSLTQTTDDKKKDKKLKKEDEDKCKKLLNSKDCTTDWYELSTQKNPQMRELNSTLMDESKFQNWTESRFFNPDQVQLCLFSEYPDEGWGMSLSRRENMKVEMKRALDVKNTLYKLNLGFQMKFNRKNPPGTNHKASIDQMKTLNTSLIHDCQTRKQLLEFTDFDCRKAMEKDRNANFTITYYEAFSPYIILGNTKNASLLTRKPFEKEEGPLNVKELMHDIKLTYMCAQDEWEIVSSLNSTYQSLQRNKAMLVDPETCKYKDGELTHWFNELSEESKIYTINRDVTYQRVSLMLFSMLISSSFLASYSLTTFYVGVVFVLGSTVRTMLIWPSYKSFIYEAVETDSVLKLVDYVYNRRYEEDLVGEEEGYRMLREILHTPEFFKSICGSCLRGTLDPSKDFLSEEDEAKIKQIESLEAKGFEVKTLKEKILQNAAEKQQRQYQETDANDEDDNFQKVE